MRTRPLLALVPLVLLTGSMLGQESLLPDAPGFQQASAPSSSSSAPPPPAQQGSQTAPVNPDEKQPKRILEILPNFRSVSAHEVVPPQTPGSKFLTATEDNFDYSSLTFCLFVALESEAANSTPEFHKGAPGFARYYWHTVADQTIENYMVEFFVPAATHEDTRYYALGHSGGGMLKRAGYAVSRAFVTKTDKGKPTFNISEVAGAGIAVSISDFYYPSKERTVSNTLDKWGYDVFLDALTFMFHEFWPDISHGLMHKSSNP